MIGVLNRFEVWSPESWDAFTRESERLLDDVSLDIQWPPAPQVPAAPPDTPPETPSARSHPQAKPKS